MFGKGDGGPDWFGFLPPALYGTFTSRDVTENTGYSHLPRITHLHGHLPRARILVQKGKACFKYTFALPDIFERKMQMG